MNPVTVRRGARELRPRVLVFDPYIATMGGGEQYCLHFAHVLSEGADVTVGGTNPPSVERLARMGLPTGPHVVAMDDKEFSAQSEFFDTSVVLTNRVPPTSRSLRSILIVQFPFPGSWMRTPWRALNRSRILGGYEPVCYSEFVRGWCRTRWRITPTVISPPLLFESRDPARKDDVILSVGRFFRGEHSKRQDVLIEAFRRMSQRLPQTWRLVLAGGIRDDHESASYLRSLKEAARGLRVDFVVNASARELSDLYSTSSIFWHAAGYRRPTGHPERAEHFGMTTVEAMSNGLVPLVYPDGGQNEIVTDQSGCFWRTFEELEISTFQLVGDPSLRRELAEHARSESQRFSYERFARAVRNFMGPPVFGPIRGADVAQAASATE